MKRGDRHLGGVDQRLKGGKIMDINTDRGLDLKDRLTLFFTHFCQVQKLEFRGPLPAVVEFLVNLFEEKI
jgi:hypothetical protein